MTPWRRSINVKSACRPVIPSSLIVPFTSRSIESSAERCESSTYQQSISTDTVINPTGSLAGHGTMGDARSSISHSNTDDQRLTEPVRRIANRSFFLVDFVVFVHVRYVAKFLFLPSMLTSSHYFIERSLVSLSLDRACQLVSYQTCTGIRRVKAPYPNR